MAIFHYHAGIVSRAKGSILATAAYQSGSILKDELTGITHNYKRRKHVGYTEIIAKSGSPAWVFDQAKLWSAVNLKNVRHDAQLAFNIEMALPIELDMPAWIELAREFTKPWANRGQVLQISIHENFNNPHMHIIATQNELNLDSSGFDSSGFGKKNREWSPEFRNGKRASADDLNEDRQRWANLCNAALIREGYAEKATLHSGTLQEQGLTHQAGKHEGKWRYIKARESDSQPSMDLQQAKIELEWIAQAEKQFHLLLASLESGVRLAKQALLDFVQSQSKAPPKKSERTDRPNGLVIVHAGVESPTTTTRGIHVHHNDT